MKAMLITLRKVRKRNEDLFSHSFFDRSHTSLIAELLTKLDKEEILSKLDKTKTALEQAKERLEVVASQSREQKRLESRENDHAMLLRRWVLRVRSHVLVPSDSKVAEAARPQFGLLMTQPMKDVIADANQLGIGDMPDTDKMLNFFQCMSWGLTALALIRRKPSISEINYLIAEADRLQLPDERALRTMKFMANRGNQWQLKIEKALAPKPGETRSISVSSLNEIVEGVQELPLTIPEIRLVQAAIDDKGKRHCICGGPNDGKEMLCCDKCKKWFHGVCMNQSLWAADEGETWLCPSCGGKEIPNSPRRESGDTVVVTVPLEPPPSDSYFISPHAPDPKKLWPPFGLLGSKPAIEALGLECSAIPEEEAAAAQPVQQQNSLVVKQQQVSASSRCPTSHSFTPAEGVQSHEAQTVAPLAASATQEVASLNATPSAQLAAVGAESSLTQPSSSPVHEVSTASVDRRSNSEALQQTVSNATMALAPENGNMQLDGTGPLSTNNEVLECTPAAAKAEKKLHAETCCGSSGHSFEADAESRANLCDVISAPAEKMDVETLEPIAASAPKLGNERIHKMPMEGTAPTSDEADDMHVDPPAVHQRQQPPSSSPPPPCHGSTFEHLAQVVTTDAFPVKEASA
jgi:hypothetical protein